MHSACNGKPPRSHLKTWPRLWPLASTFLQTTKGSLQETTVALFAKAGYDVRITGRSYYPSIDDPEIECILIRPQEMARYVGQGVLDCAVTGHDWVLETGADVEEIADLRAPWPNYGPVRWILAVKDDSEFQTPTSDVLSASLSSWCQKVM